MDIIGIVIAAIVVILAIPLFIAYLRDMPDYANIRLSDVLRRPIGTFKLWKMDRVRAIRFRLKDKRSFYISFTPHLNVGVPWLYGRRIRIGTLHGFQVVQWHNNRWRVEKQVAGKTKVKGEKYMKEK